MALSIISLDHCLTEIYSYNKYYSGPQYSLGTALSAEDMTSIQTHPNPHLYLCLTFVKRLIKNKKFQYTGGW